jgi:hypothetical protein
MCGRGGIGRRAALRSLWGNSRGSSSLLDRTIFPEIAKCGTPAGALALLVHRQISDFGHIHGRFGCIAHKMQPIVLYFRLFLTEKSYGLQSRVRLVLLKP